VVNVCDLNKRLLVNVRLDFVIQSVNTLSFPAKNEMGSEQSFEEAKAKHSKGP
jgi:hypothetical protein